jgi:hypothetical protein
MHFKPPNCMRLQGAADARRRVRRRPFVPQVPDNNTDAVPCERIPILLDKLYRKPLRISKKQHIVVSLHDFSFHFTKKQKIRKAIHVVAMGRLLPGCGQAVLVLWQHSQKAGI